ncbi:MAG: hypothetical protein ACI4LO_09890 [Anaerovoracaceae bacterium]
MKKNIFSVLLFLIIIGFFCFAVTDVGEKTEAEGAKSLREAIRRATVQCYAIEGRYPSSVDYLVENYGIQIDEEKYAVFYEGFASNVMPDITVCEIIR